MWGLEVSHNPVRSVPAMAFYGLERALWELHLHHDLLTEMPVESIALLKKLTVLNLAGEEDDEDDNEEDEEKAGGHSRKLISDETKLAGFRPVFPII